MESTEGLGFCHFTACESVYTQPLLWFPCQVSDVDNDVRRAAVTGLGFILFR